MPWKCRSKSLRDGPSPTNAKQTFVGKSRRISLRTCKFFSAHRSRDYLTRAPHPWNDTSSWQRLYGNDLLLQQQRVVKSQSLSSNLCLMHHVSAWHSKFVIAVCQGSQSQNKMMLSSSQDYLLLACLHKSEWHHQVVRSSTALASAAICILGWIFPCPLLVARHLSFCCGICWHEALSAIGSHVSSD